jgi:hypothetical protein
MEIGIIGLPQSGKTALFRALTSGKAEAVARSPGAESHIGVAKVPDPRLQGLEGMFHPRRTIPAEVRYLDVAASPRGLGKGEGWSGPLLSQLSQADALIHVVRAFPEESIPHIEGSLDPHRDLATIDLELSFADLAIVERRLARLEVTLKSARPQERQPLLREQALLFRIREGLEKEVPLREQDLGEEEARMLEGFTFLTSKPLLAVLNLGEEDLPRSAAIEAEWRSRYPRPHFQVVALSAKLESELSELSEAEAQEFRSALGAGDSGVDRVVRCSYELLDLVSFFTVVSEEVKVWTVARGTPALKAAGKIHSDMERGFIRAEVVSYDDLMRSGSLAEARKHGLLRLEGKGYPVQDGDVITFLFNV